MRLWTGLLLLSIIMLGSAPPCAAQTQAQVRERKARKACLSGDLFKGISILAELYVETTNPIYLHNQARCYENNLKYDQAIERFHEYLRKAPDLSAADRAAVNQHIADCEAALAKAQARKAPPAAPPPQETPVVDNQPPVSPAPLPPPPPAAITPTPTATVATSPAAAPVEYPWQHTAKWIAAGAAAGLLTLGVVEHVRYYTKNRDYNNSASCLATPSSCKGLTDSADTAQTWAAVGYIAGGLTAAAALVFWLTDSPRPQRSAFNLQCAPNPTGLGCAGTF